MIRSRGYDRRINGGLEMKKYIVELSHEEREKLQGVIRAARMAAHKRLHAQMLLKLDQGPEGPGWTDAQVAKAYDCKPRTAERLRQRARWGLPNTRPGKFSRRSRDCSILVRGGMIPWWGGSWGGIKIKLEHQVLVDLVPEEIRFEDSIFPKAQAHIQFQEIRPCYMLIMMVRRR